MLKHPSQAASDYFAKYTFSPNLTIPTGFSLRVEWTIWFTGEGYTSTCLNSIAWHLVNTTDNSLFTPNSIKTIHAGGSSIIPVTEKEHIYQENVAYVAAFKGSMGTGSQLTDISTLELYRNAVKYVYSTVSPFTKPSEAELVIEFRNTRPY